ncbi:hypothetical protein GCM10018790_13320 [Kitasatospora xanthocidica]|uniref:hypothetical protein n=1 Tax=Kitasatospora xanthocidica TaxID=83382 RepID=UPI00167BF501|nr:hypothetical protein [Kitasatospora xanthocidica]GHF37031.1 hypothetical protein GCM10018790_13320 [Kitasatospora xanthocidica]
MDWARLSERPGLDPYLQELALFLDAHFGRTFALLWPENDPVVPPGADGPPDTALAGHVAAGLTALLGWRVEHTTGAPPSAGHLLVIQSAGSSRWTLRTPGDPAAEVSTLTGEALYLPPGYRADGIHSEDARHVRLVVTDPEQTPPAAPAVPAAEARRD